MVKQKFMQFFDISTATTGFQVFTINAGGPLIKQRLAPFFQAYKYYKLGKVNVKCVPAATLPVDPTGMSYEVGENTVDPRDQFNPGLVRITNGENMNLGSSMNINRYHSTMLDKRWYKFRLQGGFQRSAIPLVWNVAQPVQDVYPGQIYMGTDQKGYQFMPGVATSVDNPVRMKEVFSPYTQVFIPKPTLVNGGTGMTMNTAKMLLDDVNLPVNPNGGLYVKSTAGGASTYHAAAFDSRYMIQNQREKLGWMPTDCQYTRIINNDGTISYESVAGYSPIPEVELMTFVLPQAYKTRFYYRVFVETSVYFKDPVVIDPFLNGEGQYAQGLPVDRFVDVPVLGGTNVDYPSYGNPIETEDSNDVSTL